MDSNELKKKFFDVAPPKQAPAPQASVQQHKNQMINVTSGDESETTIDPMLATVATVVHREKVIETPESMRTPAETDIVPSTTEVTNEPETPVTVEQTTAEPTPVDATRSEPDTVPEPMAETIESPPTVDPLPETANADTEQSAPVDSPDTQEQPADKDVPVIETETYAASDALPDDSQKLAGDTKATMQDPKIYDTNVYHVPIKETVHGHGSAKAAFAFGALCAVVAVAAAVYFMVKLGS